VGDTHNRVGDGLEFKEDTGNGGSGACRDLIHRLETGERKNKRGEASVAREGDVVFPFFLLGKGDGSRDWSLLHQFHFFFWNYCITYNYKAK